MVYIRNEVCMQCVELYNRNMQSCSRSISEYRDVVGVCTRTLRREFFSCTTCECVKWLVREWIC